MWDKFVDDCLAALKLIPDWFITSKMIEIFHNTLHVNDNILSYKEDFDKVTYIANQRHILAVNLDKINLDNDNSFNLDDPDTIDHVRLFTQQRESTKHKPFKKIRIMEFYFGWWNFSMSEDKNKEIQPIFTE